MEAKNLYFWKKVWVLFLFVCRLFPRPQDVIVRDPHLFYMDSKAYQLNRLSDEQRQSPIEVLQSLFKEMTLEEIRAAFQDFVYLAMTTLEEKEDNYRGDTLFMIEKLEQLIESAYLLQLNHK